MSKKDKRKNTDKFEPSPKQLAYLKAFINAGVNDTQEAIYKKAGVAHSTVWQWKQKPEFVEWFLGEVDKIFTSELPDVYKNIKRMTRNKTDACKLFMQRFDREFSERKNVEVKGALTISALFDRIENGTDKETD